MCENNPMNRALRRHLLARAKRRVAVTHRYARGNARVIGMLARTPAPCSCPMCGNPRRHFGKRTLKEIVMDEVNTNNE